MNPLTNIKNLNKLNENEIRLGAVGSKTSWHNQYRDSAWVFFAGMPFDLTEGDIICVFSQYGEIVNINLIREKKTGKSRGFGFICYENQLSTDLAVDNFNGTKILERVIRVDHVANYKPPKDFEDADDVTKFLRQEGCLTSKLDEKQIQRNKTEQESQVRVKQERDDDSRRERYSTTKREEQGSRMPNRDRSRDRDRRDNRHKIEHSRRTRSSSTSSSSNSRSHSRERHKKERRYEYDQDKRRRDRSRDRSRDRDRHAHKSSSHKKHHRH